MTPACNLKEDGLPVAAVGFDIETGARFKVGFGSETGVRFNVGLGAGTIGVELASATDSRGDPNGDIVDRPGIGLVSFC